MRYTVVFKHDIAPCWNIDTMSFATREEAKERIIDLVDCVDFALSYSFRVVDDAELGNMLTYPD